MQNVHRDIPAPTVSHQIFTLAGDALPDCKAGETGNLDRFCGHHQIAGRFCADGIFVEFQMVNTVHETKQQDNFQNEIHTKQIKSLAEPPN